MSHGVKDVPPNQIAHTLPFSYDTAVDTNNSLTWTEDENSVLGNGKHDAPDMRMRNARPALHAPPIVKTRRRPAVAWVSETPYGIVCMNRETMSCRSKLRAPADMVIDVPDSRT